MKPQDMEIRFKVPEQLHRVFVEIARSRGLTMQALAVEILETYTRQRLAEAQSLVHAAAGLDTPRVKPQLYILRRGDGGPVKIGVTRDLDARIKQLQTACDEPIKVLACVEQSEAVSERSLHRRFAKDRKAGEWFKPTPEILEFVGELSRTGR